VRSPLPILLAMSACASAPPPPPSLPPRAVTPPPPAARGDAPRERRYTLESDRLPPEFAYLPPRDREQWHACRAFFLRRRPTACGPDDDPRACGPGRPSIHLEFTVHVADYLGEPDAAARRALLIAHGCPDTLVDLADGTHLDLVEGPKEPDAGAAP
jgi:hypothetical protein